MKSMNFAGEKILSAAVAGLEAVDSRRLSLDDYLDGELAVPEFRRTVSDLLFHIFRRRVLLERCIRGHVRKAPAPEVQRVLLTVLAQISFQNGIAGESALNIAVEFIKKTISRPAANFVNGLVRNILREGGIVFSETPEDVLPPAVLKRWKERFSPEELQDFVRVFLTPADFTFRVERDFAAPEGSETIPAFGSFRFCRSKNPAAILESAELCRGEIYIQDPATSLAPSLGDFSGVKKVLDLCAAPGGKTLMLGERLGAGGMLVAADRSARRQVLTRKNVELRKLPWHVITAEPADVAGEFDLVLADVPCSNTGVFRRRPDALWRFSGSELAQIMRLQREIMDHAVRRIVPGGQFIYSTCSIELQENHNQVEKFLERYPEFTLLTEKQLLPTMEHDGAYAALLLRRK